MGNDTIIWRRHLSIKPFRGEVLAGHAGILWGSCALVMCRKAVDQRSTVVATVPAGAATVKLPVCGPASGFTQQRCLPRLHVNEEHRGGTLAILRIASLLSVFNGSTQRAGPGNNGGTGPSAAAATVQLPLNPMLAICSGYMCCKSYA